MQQVLISRDDFHRGLITLRVALSGEHPPDVILCVRDSYLLVKAGGSSLKIPALGEWDVQARLRGKAIALLTDALPEEDPLPLTRSEDYLGIGTLRLSCHWEKPILEPIGIPINASLVDILGIGQKYEPEAILRSGLEPKVIAAEQERASRITAAYNYLKPLGVTLDELTILVDESIKRANLENNDDPRG